jgi:hypothetical protein
MNACSSLIQDGLRGLVRSARCFALSLAPAMHWSSRWTVDPVFGIAYWPGGAGSACAVAEKAR